MYDPAIGRFTGVDPIADDFAYLSGYNYAGNNPIANIDLHGLQGIGFLFQFKVSPISTGTSVGTSTATSIATTSTTMSTPLLPPVSTSTMESEGTDTGTSNKRTPAPSPNDTPDDTNDEIVLYRGVGTDKPAMHKLAMMGTAIPLGMEDGHSDPELHNEGDNWSIFTSWTTNETKAAEFARNNGPGGVILSKTFKLSETVPSPDEHNEQEVLVPGVVRGAAIEIVK